jgi:hypothetical protein
MITFRLRKSFNESGQSGRPATSRLEHALHPQRGIRLPVKSGFVFVGSTGPSPYEYPLFPQSDQNRHHGGVGPPALGWKLISHGCRNQGFAGLP